MGYYSNVRLMVSKKGYKELNNYIENYIQKNKLNVSYNLLKVYDFLYENENSYYFGWDDAYWYKDKKEIEALMLGLKELKNKQCSYSYFEKGEDISDYEEINFKGNDDIDLEITTSRATFFEDSITIEENGYKEVKNELLDIVK